jgi:hypothetical protein
LLVLAVLVVLPASSPAGAQVAVDPFVQQQIRTFGATGLGMKCPQLAFLDFSRPRIGVMKYLPEKETLSDWTRMLAVSVIRLPQDKRAAVVYMEKLAETYRSQYETSTRVVNAQTRSSPDGFPALHMEYSFGENGRQVYAIGVFGKHADSASAFVQALSVGKPFSEADKVILKQFYQTVAGIY